MVKYLNYFQYNSKVILTYFFLSLLALALNKITNKKANIYLFSSYRSSLFDPLTYFRLVSHSLGHKDWNHFTSNFLYILLIGPMIEEKYGSITLLKMIVLTSLITGIINSIIGKNSILGASGIVFMLIILSSLVNLQASKIPITLILIFIFYIVDEIRDGLFKKDNISHLSHIIGALCGGIYGFYFL